jgi:hypothetical protein
VTTVTNFLSLVFKIFKKWPTTKIYLSHLSLCHREQKGTPPKCSLFRCGIVLSGLLWSFGEVSVAGFFTVEVCDRVFPG